VERANQILSIVLLVALGCSKQEKVAPLTEDNAPPDDACGAVSGKVVHTGPAPVLEKLGVETNPECSAHYQGQTAFQENVVVGPEGGLGNVFVYVKSGLDPKWKFPTPKTEVKIANEKCVYVPRISGAMHGQDVKFVNEDSFQHNVHTFVVKGKGKDINQSIYAKGQSFVQTFDSPQVMVELKCDLHSWMKGYLGVLPHPYFCVTGKDGAWTFPRKLPEGTYVIVAWQEKYGEKEITVTVKKGETVTVPEISFP